MARTFGGMYIGGNWTATAKTFQDLNPADGSVWAEVPDGWRSETAAAIEAAHAAFPEWSQLPFSKRALALHKAAEIWEKRKQDIIDAIQAEGGGWFGKGMFETGYVTEIFHAAAASVWQSTGEVMPSEYGKVSMACAAHGRQCRSSARGTSPASLGARLPVPARCGQHHRLEALGRNPILAACCSRIFEETGPGASSTSSPARDNVAEWGQ